MKSEQYVARHYSLLVDDLEQSVTFLETAFGMQFRAPARIPFLMKGHSDEWTQPTRAVYDTNGLVEIVEVAERGLFARDAGTGLHHFGGVVTDFEAAVEEQQALGNQVEWTLFYEGQPIAAFFAGTPALPGRLELVNAKAPPLLDLFAETPG